MEPVEPVLKNIYQSNTYRKDSSWPHFKDEPRAQKKQQEKEQQSCIFIFVACLTIPSGNQGHHQTRRDNSISYISTWVYVRFKRDIEQPQEKETSYNESRLLFCWRQF